MKHPRLRELVLLVGACVIFMIGYVQLGSPAGLALFTFVAVYAVLHVATRALAPQADPLLLPVSAFLVAIGIMQLASIDAAHVAGGSDWRALAPLQAGWLAAGGVGYIVTLAIFRRGLGTAWQFRYTLALLGIVALLAPLLPGIGHTVNGARLWLRAGPLSFQPGEAAKVLLVLFFAAYLADRRELLGLATRRVGVLQLPDPRYVAPLGGIIALALLIFVRQNDLGSSLLFFVTFMALLWVSTGKLYYPVLGLALFAGGVYVALQLFGHIRLRFDAWLDAFATPQTRGFQLVQGWFALAEGGLSGMGLVGPDTQPNLIPFGWTDLILVVVGHTLGLAGLLAVLMAFIVLLTRTFFIALRSGSEVHALAATGFGVVVGIQAGLIAGGVTRVLPLTGVTLPFVSYGGSSLLANFVILACLVAISNSEATTVLATRPRPRDREEAMA